MMTGIGLDRLARTLARRLPLTFTDARGHPQEDSRRTAVPAGSVLYDSR